MTEKNKKIAIDNIADELIYQVQFSINELVGDFIQKELMLNENIALVFSNLMNIPNPLIAQEKEFRLMLNQIIDDSQIKEYFDKLGINSEFIEGCSDCSEYGDDAIEKCFYEN